MEPFAAALIEALNNDPDAWLRATQSVVATTPSMGQEHYSVEELQQLLNGFRALVTEALEEREPEAYTLFIETAIPGMVAAGQTTESLVHASAAFSVMVSLQLVQAVSAEHRESARSWLACFFGEYVRRVHCAARQAEGVP